MCAHLAISAASEATGAMSGVCAVAVGALAGLIGLKVSFAAPPRAPKKRQPRNGVTERERPRCAGVGVALTYSSMSLLLYSYSLLYINISHMYFEARKGHIF